jgi:hypothetical protein
MAAAAALVGQYLPIVHAVCALLPIGQKVPGAHVNCVGTDAPYTQK